MFSDNVIRVCINCYGKEPCLCDNKEYINMEEWIYNLMHALNPM